MNEEQIIEASRIGTFKAISQIALILLIVTLIFVIGLLTYNFISDNHEDFKMCKRFMENPIYDEQDDYVCKYFGEKNHWDVWEKSKVRMGIYKTATITIYARDKTSESLTNWKVSKNEK